MKILVICIPLLFITACTTQKPVEKTSDCEVSAHSIRLMSSLCQLTTGVSYTKSKVILNCLDQQEKQFSHLKECKKRFALKSGLCKKMIRLGRVDLGLVSCINDKNLDKKWQNGNLTN
jgi:hypothetical protein